MDIQQEIWRVSGEVMGVQLALGGFFAALIQSDPEKWRPILNNALGYADAVADAGAIKLAGKQADAHLRSMVNVIDTLRELTRNDGGKPQSGI